MDTLEYWLECHPGCWFSFWVSSGGTRYVQMGYSGETEPRIEVYANTLPECVDFAIEKWEEEDRNEVD